MKYAKFYSVRKRHTSFLSFFPSFFLSFFHWIIVNIYLSTYAFSLLIGKWLTCWCSTTLNLFLHINLIKRHVGLITHTHRHTHTHTHTYIYIYIYTYIYIYIYIYMLLVQQEKSKYFQMNRFTNEFELGNFGFYFIIFVLYTCFEPLGRLIMPWVVSAFSFYNEYYFTVKIVLIRV